MSDDRKPPAAGGGPPIPPRRKSRRQKSRGREWLRPSQATPPLASPAAVRMLFVALVVLAVAVLAYVVNKKPVVTEKVFLNPATVETGTSPAAVATAEKERIEKRALVEKLFGPEMWHVKDGEDFDEEPQWRKAVSVMANLDPKFIEEHLQFSLNLHYDEVMKDPAAFRGQFVRMRGIVGKHFSAVKLDKPIDGRVDVFRGQISDPDDTERVIFDVLDRPPPFVPMYDGVEVDGIFYRIVKYETRPDERGRIKVVEVPWIIGRTVVVRDTDKSAGSVGLGLGAMTAFLALLFGIVYLVRRGRRTKTAVGAAPVGFRAMFERKLGQERRKEPPPPSGGSGD